MWGVGRLQVHEICSRRLVYRDALRCVKHLEMIELMVVLFLLMTFTRMVSMVLVLMGVGPILGNRYGI